MPAVVLLAALNQGGCSDLKTIDRQTDALIRSRSDWVGGDPAPPSSAARNWPDGRLSGPERRRLTETEPTTRNPSARELRYDVADEARDVAGRLQAYQQAERADALELDLPAAWRQSQVTGREFLIAQDDFILSAIRLLVERHLWDPRLFATSTLSFDSAQDDGNVSSTLALINEVGVTQRLPYGGEVAARWVWNATEDLRSRTTGQYVQASELILEGSVPLLRGAGTVAREGLIQAERDLIYAARDFEQFRREYLVSIARDYFALVQQEQGIENLRNQLKSLRGLEEQQRALYEAGLIAEFELNIASSEVVSATANLAGALESLVLATDRFAIRLGLPVGRGLALRPVELVIPEPEVTPDRATELALAYRLDLQNRRDQLDDARRGVVNARNGLLPDLDLSADVAFPTDADEDEGGVVYEPDDVRYGAAVTFGVPLDRRNERLALRAATIALARADRDLDRVRDEAVVGRGRGCARSTGPGSTCACASRRSRSICAAWRSKSSRPTWSPRSSAWTPRTRSWRRRTRATRRPRTSATPCWTTCWRRGNSAWPGMGRSCPCREWRRWALRGQRPQRRSRPRAMPAPGGPRQAAAAYHFRCAISAASSVSAAAILACRSSVICWASMRSRGGSA